MWRKHMHLGHRKGSFQKWLVGLKNPRKQNLLVRSSHVWKKASCSCWLQLISILGFCSDWPYENLMATDWGQKIYLFVPKIIIFFSWNLSCPNIIIFFYPKFFPIFFLSKTLHICILLTFLQFILNILPPKKTLRFLLFLLTIVLHHWLLPTSSRIISCKRLMAWCFWQFQSCSQKL